MLISHRREKSGQKLKERNASTSGGWDCEKNSITIGSRNNPPRLTTNIERRAAMAVKTLCDPGDEATCVFDISKSL